MRCFQLLVVLLLIAGCASSRVETGQSPSIDAEVPADAVAGGALPEGISGLEGLSPFTAQLDGVDFVLGVDEAGSVRYVETRDPKFVTPDKIGARTTVTDLMDGVGKGKVGMQVRILPGGRSAFTLRSGWSAVLPPSDRLETGSRVEWVFLLSAAV